MEKSKSKENAVSLEILHTRISKANCNLKGNNVTNTNLTKQREEGITLVALIITIIILVILAAISVASIYNTKVVEHATNGSYNYASESLRENAVMEGTGNLVDSTLDRIEEILGGSGLLADTDENDTVKITFNSNSGTGTMTAVDVVKGEEITLPENIFEKNGYEFKEWNTKSNGTGTRYANKGKINTTVDTTLYAIWKLPIESYEELLAKSGVTGTYTKDDLASNKDGILEKVLSKDLTRNYLLDHYSEYGSLLVGSQVAMTVMGQNSAVKDKVMSSNDWGKGIANSSYRANFSKYLVYNAETRLARMLTSRYYYKKKDGSALFAAFDPGKGHSFLLIAKTTDATIGYSSYNTSLLSSDFKTLSVNGSTWYYAEIPYGSAWNEHPDELYYGADVPGYTSIEDAAKTVLRDYLGVTIP